MRRRRKFQVTSASERAKFVLMRACGMSFSAIARATDVSVSTVFRWIQLWLQEGLEHIAREANAVFYEVDVSAGTPPLSPTWMKYIHPYPFTYEHQHPLHYTHGNKFRVQPLSSIYSVWKWYTKLNQHLIYFWINHYQRALQMRETEYLPRILEHLHWRLYFAVFLIEKLKGNNNEKLLISLMTKINK
nr:uncharacterized protein LOC128691541 [Cherax quadricarinatus]